MKRSLASLAALAVLTCIAPAQAQTPASPQPAASAPALCDTCGSVTQVHEETRKGKGTLLGKLGGAVAGGLLGNQVGGGNGKTLATVGGAAGGAYVGNEIEKKVKSKKVWVTSVRMKDGSVKNFEQESQPAWSAGQVVKVDGNTLTRQ